MAAATESVTVTLECHGELQSLCAGREQRLRLAPAENTVNDAVAALAKTYPGARAMLARCAYALGDRLVSGEQAVQEGEVIALIPPVSGG